MTIDELMEGKAPGSVKIVGEDWELGEFFCPYFKDAQGDWHGSSARGNHSCFSNKYTKWRIYTEPKPKKIVYEVMDLDTEGRWYIKSFLYSKEEIMFHWKKTGRKFEVEE